VHVVPLLPAPTSALIWWPPRGWPKRHVLSDEELGVAVDDTDRIMRPLDDDYFDLLADRHGHLSRRHA